MSKRRIVSLKQFAVSIRIFDLITTWHTRGLGAKYPDNPEAEIMFYAAGAYLTAECIIAAISILELTTSTAQQMNKLIGYLKETIIIDNNRPSVRGDYYVSKHTKEEVLLKHLKK